MDEAKSSVLPHHILSSVATGKRLTPPDSESGLNDVLVIARWSRFTRVLRVMGWLLRFQHNCTVTEAQHRQGELSFAELSEAKIRLLRYVQHIEFSAEWLALRDSKPVSKKSPLFKLSPFLGKDDLLRVQGRLQFEGLPYEVTHPILIPKCHLGVLLARHEHLHMKHAGVNVVLTELRNQYWLIGGRRVCKQAKKECVSCHRIDVPAGSQTMAPLPAMRVTQSPPFSVTGLDHGGPLYCGDYVGKKFYIILLTCALTRAIH